VSDDTGRTFLSRWSRRKIEARAAERAPAEGLQVSPAVPLPVQAPAAGAAAATPGDPAAASTEPQAELPDPETLRGLESDYRGFLRPEVDESLRRTALKKLFADPHFNVMDGLDVYIDDYSKPDPITPELLRSLNQARGLRLFEDEEAGEAAEASAGGTDTVVASQHAVTSGDAHASEPPGPDVGHGSTDCPAGAEAPSVAPERPAPTGKTG
jgi:Protein of unknown function (DUF3306)